MPGIRVTYPDALNCVRWSGSEGRVYGKSRWQRRRDAGKKGKDKEVQEKERKHVPHGIATINASFNNTIVTIADPSGNVISWKSSGSLGFRGSRKGTPFAAQQAAMNAANMAREHGLRSVDVRVSGPGRGASRQFARWPRQGWTCAILRIRRRFRTTVAVRRSAAEFKAA